MITKNKIFLLSIIVLFTCCAKSQEVKEYNAEKKYPLVISSTSANYNLKGKVKEVASYIKYNNIDKDKENFNQGLRHYDIQTPSYRKFNKWGGAIRSALEFYVDTLTLTVTDTLEINVKEYLDEKEKLSKYIDRKFEYPFINPHPIFSNFREYTIRSFTNDWHYKYIDEHHYVYNDAEYPLEEKMFSLIDENHNGVHDEGEDKKLRRITVFNYDKDNKILSKDIRFKPSDNVPNSADTDLIDEFSVHVSSVGHYEYRYDEKGRITEVLIYIDKELYKKTKYTYHPEGWVMKREIDAYVARIMFHENGWKFVVEFDKNGNFTKGWTYNRKGELINERHYEYQEFDSHKNWLKCELYTNNDKSRPAVVYKRRIEYYKD